MIPRPGGARPAPLGVALVLPVVGFVSLAPAGLLMLPMGALSGLFAARSREALAIFAVSGTLAVWWLVRMGPPPEQVLRAGAVLATMVFVAVTVGTSASATHRGLFAVGVAALSVAGLVAVTGRDWMEVQWWVAHGTSTTRMVLIGAAMMASGITGSPNDLVAEMERVADQLPNLAAMFFPGLIGLQVFAGLMLAAYIATRLGLCSGAGVGRFAEFSFTGHLGWLAMAAVALVMWGPSGALWIAAVNTVFVAAVLYGFRGLAVLAATWPFSGARSVVFGLTGLVAGLLLWRVALVGLILVGATDAGLDLRHRWLKQG